MSHKHKHRNSLGESSLIITSASSEPLKEARFVNQGLRTEETNRESGSVSRTRVLTSVCERSSGWPFPQGASPQV